MTGQQLLALRVLRQNHGEASELTLHLEGLGNPRLTLRALSKIKLVTRGQYVDEEHGILWRMTKKGWEA